MKIFKGLFPLVIILSLNNNVFAETNDINNNTTTEQLIENVDDNFSTLTIDKAFEIAVEYNRELKNFADELPDLQYNYEERQKELKINGDNYYSIKTQIFELENTLNNYDENIQKTKDILKYDITKLFVNIQNAKEDLKLSEKSLDINKKELSIFEMKYQKGIISKAEFDNKNFEYVKKYNEFQNQKIELDNLYIDINKILGIDLTKKYSIDIELKYSKISDIDINQKANQDFNNNIKLIEEQQKLEISKYEYSKYSPSTSYSTKVAKENSIENTERNISDFKIDYLETLNKLYKNILSKETANDKNLENLVQKEKEFEILKMKFSMGTVTQLEVDKLQLEILELKNTIKKNQYEHQLLVMQFENVNLI